MSSPGCCCADCVYWLRIRCSISVAVIVSPPTLATVVPPPDSEVVPGISRVSTPVAMNASATRAKMITTSLGLLRKTESMRIPDSEGGASPRTARARHQASRWRAAGHVAIESPQDTERRMRRRLIAGNWKMNGSRASLAELDGIAAAAGAAPGVDVAICPPFTLIERAVARQPGLAIGGQDCHAETKGAHTGCISAGMLVEAGATMVIVGHSERRAEQHETDADVKAKAEAAIAAGLTAIVCCGETEEHHHAGETEAVVSAQLRGSLPVAGGDALVVAYEPIWAIGTGLTPTVDDVAAVHKTIRGCADRCAGRGAGGQGAHSLWRLGQCGQCDRTARGARRRWGAGRRREPDRGGVRPDRGGRRRLKSSPEGEGDRSRSEWWRGRPRL